MNKNILRIIRTVFAVLIFIFTLSLFIEIESNHSPQYVQTILYLQFIPSFIKFLTFAGWATLGFAIVLVTTIIWGRVYCSFVCPLGILQDIISRVSQLFISKRKFKYTKAYTRLRYGILVTMILSLLSGSIVAVNVLDPYSNFGRIATAVFRPVYLLANNAVAAVMSHFSVYTVYKVEIVGDWYSVLFPVLVFAILIYMASRRGRLFCNTICPVGTFLGFISKWSIFKIQIDESLCTSCGFCMVACKSECIDLKLKTVDASRCVGCMNCVSKCDNAGIHYKTELFKIEKETSQDASRRDFATKLFAGSSTLLLGSCIPSGETSSTTEHSCSAVAPPGAKSVEHFTGICTACQLCVNACPSGVLQPSLLQYGLSGFMQPHLDFSKHFCNYECTVCSEVCPTGALQQLTTEEKKQTQIGKALFSKSKCVVYTDETACGACSEHCPTQAVHMVPYKDGLTIPEVTPDICVGCGACEYICPVRPQKAIIVSGNSVHQVAASPDSGSGAVEDTLEEFPF